MAYAPWGALAWHMTATHTLQLVPSDEFKVRFVAVLSYGTNLICYGIEIQGRTDFVYI